MQRDTSPAWDDVTEFQPSSDLQAGCNVHDLAALVGWLGVSTLIRPSGRMQRCRRYEVRGHPDVSTLIRPSGRMQPPCPGDPAGIPQGVSTLIRPSGRMQRRSPPPSGCCRRRFNPHPTFRPDATAGYPVLWLDWETVSTLIRPSGRMQLDNVRVVPTQVVFQPSSDLQAGCNLHEDGELEITLTLFQPSSDLQAGCNRIATEYTRLSPACFNPHPTFRPDATDDQFREAVEQYKFQPSSDLQAGCNN